MLPSTSKPVALGCSSAGVHVAAFHIFRVEVDHNERYWRAHGTAKLLSVKPSVILEVGGIQTEVQQLSELRLVLLLRVLSCSSSSFLINLGEPIHAWDAFPRIQAMILFKIDGLLLL